MTKIAITGALGRMGTLVIQEAAKVKDMQLVAGLDAIGAGAILPGGITVRDASELESVLRESKPDVLIDFTIAKAAVNNICTAASLGIDLVVGTTGFSAEQHSRMKEAIEGHVAGVITPNFALGVNVFWKLVADAAAALKDYDIEIIEAHHNQKKDAPSGTALATVSAIKTALGEKEVVYGREGVMPRGREIGVHAVRGGDIVGDHTVLFAGAGERLEIKHQAHSRTAFASGAVRAADWVAGKEPGIYTMADVLKSR
ncbi:MAG: 4-hydroxy-tetrahydrodipicolinate reductase [Methanothrix sp.]|nr:4-hydroxy-tetrahydrodipicolinate reductase [Methanothrix sp.]MDD4446888.1 4-hydroxy-tetrahydrodipicolinate reductase [Methanothrix sp.]